MVWLMLVIASVVKSTLNMVVSLFLTVVSRSAVSIMLMVRRNLVIAVATRQRVGAQSQQPRRPPRQLKLSVVLTVRRNLATAVVTRQRAGAQSLQPRQPPPKREDAHMLPRKPLGPRNPATVVQATGLARRPLSTSGLNPPRGRVTHWLSKFRRQRRPLKV